MLLGEPRHWIKHQGAREGGEEKTQENQLSPQDPGEDEPTGGRDSSRRDGSHARSVCLEPGKEAGWEEGIRRREDQERTLGSGSWERSRRGSGVQGGAGGGLERDACLR